MSKKKPYRYFLYLLLLLVRDLSNRMPRFLILGIVKFVGRVTWSILPKERQKTLEQLRTAFGDSKSPAELIRIGRQVFENLGATAIDTLRIPKLKREWPKPEALIKEDHVFSKIEEARWAGKGLICLTGHIGNWELIYFFMIQSGYDSAVVGRRIYYEPFNRVLETIRKKAGAKVFYRDESPRGVLGVLRNNQAVGILADQDIDSVEGIFVPFFGKLARTPSAPARISLASGAPILPVFMIREGMSYRFMADELIWPESVSSLSKEDAVLTITKRWSEAVESVVRRFPEQWAWMHRRWKTQPETGRLASGSDPV